MVLLPSIILVRQTKTEYVIRVNETNRDSMWETTIHEQDKKKG